MKNLFFILLIFTHCLFSCSNEEDPSTPPEPTILEGTLIDAEVEGVYYQSGSVSGTTDSAGTFQYEEGNNVSFRVGGIQLGETAGQAQISPIELSGTPNASISTPEVRNIASFLQSLDEDGKPENGITISSSVSEFLSGESLDFESGNFHNSLKSLLERLNEKGNSLQYVTANQAAKHLAGTLGKESEYRFLPTVLQGREWEDGTYRKYNTTGEDGKIIFNIYNKTDSVQYLFSEGAGYVMDMEYKNDTLFGYGNYYRDVTDPTTAHFEYSHRISSPGVVFDYNDTTFLGYYNYQKVDGEAGVLEGTYQSFLFFERKRTGEDPFRVDVLNNIVVIEENSEEDFKFTLSSPDGEPEVIFVNKADVDAEQLMLVQLNGLDYLFVEFYANIGLFPGLFSVKPKE